MVAAHPSICTRPANVRIFNRGLLAKLFLVVAHFASPQAGEMQVLARYFSRYK